MIILGERELKENLISVRKRGMEDLGSMTCEDFYHHIKEEIKKEKEV